MGYVFFVVISAICLIFYIKRKRDIKELNENSTIINSELVGNLYASRGQKVDCIYLENLEKNADKYIMTDDEFNNARNWLDATHDYKMLQSGKYRCYIIDVDEHFFSVKSLYDDDEGVDYYIKSGDLTVNVNKKTHELIQRLNRKKVVLLLFLYKRSVVLKNVFVPDDDYKSRTISVEYNGNEVSRNVIEYEQVDKNDVSVCFVNMIRQSAKKSTICNDRLNTLIANITKTQKYKEPMIGKIGIIVAAVLALPICYILPLWVLFSSGELDEIIIGIVYSVLLGGGIALYFILNRRGNKPVMLKVESLKAGNYEAYYFSDVRKMYSSERKGKRYVSEFYLDFGTFALPVSVADYDSVRNSVFLIVIHIKGKSTLEIC